MTRDCTGCGMDFDSCRYSVDHSNKIACCPECSHPSDERPRQLAPGFPARERSADAPAVDEASAVTGADYPSAAAFVPASVILELEIRDTEDLRDPRKLARRLLSLEQEILELRHEVGQTRRSVTLLRDRLTELGAAL